MKCHKEIKPRGMEAMTGYWCNLKEAGQGRPLEEMTYELQTKWGASHQKIQGKNIPEGENSLYKCPGVGMDSQCWKNRRESGGNGNDVPEVNGSHRTS